MPAFSGAFTSAQVWDVIETELDQDNSSDRDGASAMFEETESVSVGEIMKSPVFSEEDDSSDSSLWIDLGHSPFSSENFSRGNMPSPTPPSWFSGRKNHKKLSPQVPSMKKPTYEDHVLSYEDHKERPCNSEIHGKQAVKFPFADGGKTNNSTTEMKESAIRRETESEFRLLDRREGNNSRFNGGRFFDEWEPSPTYSLGNDDASIGGDYEDDDEV